MIQQFHFWLFMKKTKTLTRKKIIYTYIYIHCSIIYNSQDMEVI